MKLSKFIALFLSFFIFFGQINSTNLKYRWVINRKYRNTLNNIKSLNLKKFYLNNKKTITSVTILYILAIATTCIAKTIFTNKNKAIEQAEKDVKKSNKNKISTEQRIINSIVGAAIGDAMGKPTEFIKDAEDIIKKYKHPIKSFDDFKPEDFFYDKTTKKTFVRYTDDTAMSILITQALVNAKKNNLSIEQCMSQIAHSFVADMHDFANGWAAKDRAPGNCCLKRCNELEEKINSNKDKTNNWWAVGQTGQNGGGCGSVMRAHPFGLAFYNDVQKAEFWAVEQSKITHSDPIALAACAAMTVGVANAISGKDIDSIANAMINTAKKYSSETANMMQDAYNKAKKVKSSCNSFEQVFEKSKNFFKKYLGWAAHDAIAATLYTFYIFADNIQDAIALGVNTPGDSDSIASMAGALVGAYSHNAIPKYLIEPLENSQGLIDIAKTLTKN